MTRNFMQLAEAQWARRNFVCMGLDVDYSRVRAPLQTANRFKVDGYPANDILDYTYPIIRRTLHFVGAYKINTAFYEAMGPVGFDVIQHIVRFINEEDDRIPIIIDAKRTDIGNTNRYYVRALHRLGADAVTVNPYFGGTSLAPFLNEANLGVFVLTRTSNPGASEFQDLKVDGQELYLHVAEAFATQWNTNGNVGLVVGATYPAELSKVRENHSDIPLLIPGIGTQGGDLEATVKAARHRMFINAGSNALYASDGADFAEAAAHVALQMHKDILRYQS